MDRVLRLTTHDPAVGLKLTEVLSLLTPPALFQPWIVARVFCLPVEVTPSARADERLIAAAA